MTNNYYGMPSTGYQPSRPLYNAPLSPMGLKGRPVSSLEEAKAAAIDFDGMINYFPDIANKRVYTKQFNTDGTAIFNSYELKEIEPITTDQNQFITRDEFNAAIAQLRTDPGTSAQSEAKEVKPLPRHSEF